MSSENKKFLRQKISSLVVSHTRQRLMMTLVVLAVGMPLVMSQKAAFSGSAHEPVSVQATPTAKLVTAAHVMTKAVTRTNGKTLTAAPAPVVNSISAPVTIPAATTAKANTTSWTGLPLYADPINDASAYAAANPSTDGANLIARMGQQPVAAWFGSWNGDITADVSAYVSKAAAAQALPVLVAYNIPNRDCGGYSAGGAQTEADYAAWISRFAAGIGNRAAIVILEPDAVSLQTCLSPEQLAARNRELSNAIGVLAGGSDTHVYLDGGHSGWLSADETVSRLKAAGVAGASGFSLNISNFTTTADNVSFGSQVSSLIGGKHFVVDTSRDGNGPTPDAQWCNPAGRALGNLPTTSTGNILVDAFLWVKTPWQSDGACNGAPSAGADYWSYAVSLARAAGW